MTSEVPKIERLEKDPVAESLETHPAYAQIWASRISGGRYLYGSDFQHNGYIQITIARSDLKRGLSNDWPHSREEYIQVALSEAQWATFVSTLNSGGGTQCTACHINRKSVPEIEHPTDRKKQFKQEHSERMASAQQSILSAQTKLRALGLSEKKIKDILSDMNHAYMDIGGNLDFVSEQFGEHMEKVTEHAKIEANAYVQHVISRAGIRALSEAPPVRLLEEETKP